MGGHATGRTIWLIGLPCAGKTTIADTLKAEHMPNAVRLDGDIVRQGLCAGLGFTEQGRTENIYRCANVAQLLNAQGLDVIASFITPMDHHRTIIITTITNVHIIHISTPATICEQRDVKGMWAKARAGKLAGFTGHDSCFEIPAADLIPSITGTGDPSTVAKHIISIM